MSPGRGKAREKIGLKSVANPPKKRSMMKIEKGERAHAARGEKKKGD